ncbi:MAG: hypothetical protein GXO48_08080 [Chlorobi bacterium]|nr:hypothetical protein [Chlorobiota bacterium]
MAGLRAFLILLEWYKHKEPSKAEEILKQLSKFIESLENLNRYLEKAIENEKLSEAEVKTLYSLLFKNEYESEILSMLNELSEGLQDFEVLTDEDKQKTERILNELINNIVGLAVLYDMKVSENKDL